MSKRAFLIVMDSLGIGNAPDAKMFGDEGSDTLLSISKSDKFNMPNMQKMGFFNIDDISLESVEHPQGSFARIQEKSNGKDTTIGHWEIMGIESEKPLPTFPDGFPEDFLNEFSQKTGYKCICNKAYSGTEVLKDYAKQSVKDGALIVYTSADSVFQVAAHEEVISVEKLYNACEIARGMLTGSLAVGRVIARPFVGDEVKGYTRTARRHDFSILPPDKTLLDFLCKNGKKTIGVGKIYDIFAGQGIDETFKTANNSDGMQKTMEIAKTDFEGLCFVNLVDFDMVYGHRN
ncbi:MAG: phosphopentomutase, partial [Oscillospiraceae bacterium]